AHAFLDRLAHGVLGVELGFLRQVADLDARLRARLTLEVGVDAGHDPQHGGLAGAVQAQQADLGAGEEGKGDVLDDLLLRRDRLGHAVHGADVLQRGLAAVAGVVRAAGKGGWAARRARSRSGDRRVPPLSPRRRGPARRRRRRDGPGTAFRWPQWPASPPGPARRVRAGAASWPQMAAGATLSGLNPHRKPPMFAKDLQIAGYDPELAQAIADERRR